ncbi:F-box/kelch-repeat protein [Apostasia shenzhenica]|uniref:F-box/kelch-repeat protein n=1 Tax=Apostasia shenzhenica TaxID=1088818 RepID=A0A2I0B9P1_9ASPA|nr:F-box/kelch-repeat protein [Apostasia shenzhenica]
MMENLIPGLPEEIAVECLIRVSHQSFAQLRRVCRRWKQKLDSPLFYRLRLSAGFARSLLALTQAEHLAGVAPSQKHPSSFPAYRLTVIDPAAGEWNALPAIPGLSRGLPLFFRLASAGCKLVVVGGWDPDTLAATDSVYVYDFLAGAWRRGRPMPGPRRSFFACASSPDGRVFVAGGHDEEKNALRSAMVYDVGKDEWAPLPEMARERDECAGVIVGGMFRVLGGYSTAMQGRFGGCAESFDIGKWRWLPVEEAAMSEGESPRTSVAGDDGRVYMCRGVWVASSEAEGEGWRAVAQLPEDVRVALVMIWWKGKLVVVGTGCHGGEQAAYVLHMKQGTGSPAWLKMEVPAEYSGNVQCGCCVEI